VCVYTNSSAFATYLPTHCFQKEPAWCSIYSYIRILFCIISYDELTRERIAPYPHTAARLHYLLWKQIVTNALTVFLYSSPQTTVCSLLCVFVPIWSVTTVDARGPEKSANRYGRRRTHDIWSLSSSVHGRNAYNCWRLRYVIVIFSYSVCVGLKSTWFKHCENNRDNRK